MRWAAEAGGGDGHAAHHGGADRRGGGAAGERVETDEAKGGHGRVSAEDGLKRTLNDASEYGDLELAQDQQVNKPGRDERLLESRRDSLPDAEHHAQEDSGMRRGQRCEDGGDIARTQPRRERCDYGGGVGHVDARGIEL